MGSHGLLQGLLPTQGLNPRLLHCIGRQIHSLIIESSIQTHTGGNPAYWHNKQISLVGELRSHKLQKMVKKKILILKRINSESYMQRKRMWTDLRGWEAEGSQRNLRKGSLSMVTCLRWLVPWAKGLILKLDPLFPVLSTSQNHLQDLEESKEIHQECLHLKIMWTSGKDFSGMLLNSSGNFRISQI